MSQFRNQLLPFLETARPTYLEYIESNGTQWINTGVTAAANMKVSVTFQYMLQTIEGYDKPIVSFKKEGIGWTNCLSIGMSSTNSGLYLYGDNGGVLLVSGILTQKLTKVVAIDSGGNPTVDGVGPNNPIDYGGISLFQNANPDRNFIGRIYSCQIYDGTTMVRNFRPCLSGENGEPCMWDTVTQKYYYNAGTGKFKYEKTFIELDYIQSDGNQYIDTGIVADRLTQAEIEYCNYTVSTGGSVEEFLFGASNGNYASNNFGINLSRTQNQVLFYCNCDGYSRVSRKTAGVIAMKSDGLWVYGNLITPNRGKVPSDTDFSTLYSIYLFRLHTGTSSQINPIAVGINRFHIWQDYVLSLDMLPVYKFDGTICMYDFITGSYFTNQGTGYFKGQFTDRGKVYEILPYIQSTNGAFIDTGVCMNGNYGYTINGTSTTLTNNKCIMGASNGNYYNTGEIAVWYNNSGNFMRWEIVLPSSNTVSRVLSTPATNNTYYTIKADHGQLKSVNNTTLNEPYYIDYTGLRTIYLFATHRSESRGAISDQWKLHYYNTTYVDGGVIQELVPVRSNGVTGMYDTVSKNVLVNANTTGDFVAPNILPDGYTRLDYIQSSGTQYIDTGILIDSSNENYVRIEVDGNFGTKISGNNKWSLDGTAYTNICRYVGISGTDILAYGNGGSSFDNYTNYTATETDRTGRHLYVVDYLNGKVKRDGVTVASFTTLASSTSQPAHNIYIFGWRVGREFQENAKKYGFRIYINDNCVFSGIPCKNPSNVVGMYDTISNTFLTTPSGTGTFTPGSPI